jgi:DNA adenine methylase
MHDVGPAVRPILKWAKGKRPLLPELRPFYPRRFSRYVEPFLGSGAVFLDLHNAGLLVTRRPV